MEVVGSGSEANVPGVMRRGGMESSIELSPSLSLKVPAKPPCTTRRGAQLPSGSVQKQSRRRDPQFCHAKTWTQKKGHKLASVGQRIGQPIRQALEIRPSPEQLIF